MAKFLVFLVFAIFLATSCVAGMPPEAGRRDAADGSSPALLTEPAREDILYRQKRNCDGTICINEQLTGPSGCNGAICINNKRGQGGKGNMCNGAICINNKRGKGGKGNMCNGAICIVF